MFCKRVPSVAYAWTKRAPIVTKRFISATSFKMANANFTQGAGLDRFVKVDLLQKETPQKIQSIWVQHHHKLPCISAVLQKEQYQKLKDKAAKCPLFVFPLPRGETGFTSFYCQMLPKADRCLFSTLEEFHKNKTNASQCLTMTYYTELQDSKGIVLMKGDVNTDVITTQEAQYLANMWQLYLLDEQKYKLMEQFNLSPETFNYGEVVNDMGKLPESPIIDTNANKN